jgi:hypothetical protein
MLLPLPLLLVAPKRRMGEAMLAASKLGIARMAAIPHSVKQQRAVPCT